MADSMNENLSDSSASETEGNITELTDSMGSKLTLKERQETARRNETPPSSRAAAPFGLGQKPPRCQLFASPVGDKKPEQKDGKWLEKHPWKNKVPCCEKTMDKTVNLSKVYTVSIEWLKVGKDVDLEKIYLNLPKFIDQMKGLSIRKELEDVLNATLPTTLLEMIAPANTPSPHVREIAQKQNKVPPKDGRSDPEQGENDSFKAFSLPQQDPYQPSENNYWNLDCEYMLKMYLPEYSLQWFDNDDQEGRRIRIIIPGKKDKRWIFIPSFRRAQIALLKWPEDNIVTEESTIRILVVRPSEFEEYVKYCGHLFPVICLPQDEIGAGYPRYWIQKIALRLKLQFIWMIDDSVECFYEYHPTKKPPKRQDGKGNYTDYRRRQFGLVFERIEGLVKATKDENLPIAAMSPKRFMGGTAVKEPFVSKPPRIAVFLNITALKSQEVYYRPELQVLEDMIFGYECEKNGLKVFIDNCIHLQDYDWEDTGARAPSVQQKMT